MKALLFVFVLYADASVHPQMVEMPTMAGCEAAAQKLNAKRHDTPSLRGVRIIAICVEVQ